MVLTNTQLVPEFQHYFREFVLNSIINKNQVPIPVDIDVVFLSRQSVVELLCSDQFLYDSYYYLYRNEPDMNQWPSLTRQRLMIYPSSKYLVPDATNGINIFNLQTDDFTMLDILLQYRHDSTSIVLIDTTADTTAIIVITDATSNITTVTGNIEALSTSLSKLIYLYLDLHINGHYLPYYNISTIISDCTLLATYFELKLIDDYFDFVQKQNITFSIHCS